MLKTHPIDGDKPYIKVVDFGMSKTTTGSICKSVLGAPPLLWPIPQASDTLQVVMFWPTPLHSCTVKLTAKRITNTAGTPGYQAPEVALGEGYTSAVDMASY